MRKLYRVRKGKYIAGVCGGIAKFFEIDPKIVRLLFVLFVLACIFRKNCASVPEERSAIPLQAEQSSAG